MEHYNKTEEPVKPTNKHLLLDNRLIENTQNVRLTVGTVEKHKANPLFTEDKPWEKRFDNLYGNVIYDKEENIYKCWYSPFTFDNSAKGMTLEQRSKKYRPPKGRTMSICYATSKDGIKWEKPALGKVEYPAVGKEGYNGDKQNNIVWRGPHGTGIFKDLGDPDPSRRYKMIFQGLKVSFSADGITWDDPIKCEGVRVRGDTHNNAFWAPTLGKYVGITRTWDKKGKGRQVARIESDDFINWTKAEVVLEGNDRDQQTYAMPVFYYGGVYLGLIAIHEQSSDRVWGELAWSGNTKKWNRISPGTPLIPCSDEKLAYDYGCVYPCAYPVFLEDEVRLYYGGSDWLHYGWRNGSLCLATMRPDGFAGYESIDNSDDITASVKTRPVKVVAESLCLTADVEPSGYVKVTIFDEGGKQLAQSKPITTTSTDSIVKWNDGFSLKEMKGKKIRLKFELKKSKIFSFSFKEMY
jgi:hypothetical protein